MARRGCSSAVRNTLGSTAHSSVRPAQADKSMVSSSSAGIYTMAGFSASSASVSWSARAMDTVNAIRSAPAGASGRGEAGSSRRFGMSCRRAASSSSSSRRRPLIALADTISPSSSSTSTLSAVNTVPPVLERRWVSSSAVTARFRASSGASPVAKAMVTPLRTAHAPLSRTGSPRRTVSRRFTGIFRFSFPFSYVSRARANSSFGSGTFSGRVPNMALPFLPSQ